MLKQRLWLIAWRRALEDAFRMMVAAMGGAMWMKGFRVGGAIK